jgi:hypothetical protein
MAKNRCPSCKFPVPDVQWDEGVCGWCAADVHAVVEDPAAAEEPEVIRIDDLSDEATTQHSFWPILVPIAGLSILFLTLWVPLDPDRGKDDGGVTPTARTRRAPTIDPEKLVSTKPKIRAAQPKNAAPVAPDPKVGVAKAVEPAHPKALPVDPKIKQKQDKLATSLKQLDSKRTQWIQQIERSNASQKKKVVQYDRTRDSSLKQMNRQVDNMKRQIDKMPVTKRKSREKKLHDYERKRKDQIARLHHSNLKRVQDYLRRSDERSKKYLKAVDAGMSKIRREIASLGK